MPLDRFGYVVLPQVLRKFLVEQPVVPWDALLYVTGHINYGGRVTGETLVVPVCLPYYHRVHTSRRSGYYLMMLGNACRLLTCSRFLCDAFTLTLTLALALALTDDWDRRCLMDILAQFFNTSMLEEGHKLSSSGIYFAKPEGQLYSYRLFFINCY